MFRKQTGIAAAIIALCILAGCAGLAKMTPRERALTLCDDFISQYEAFHAESARLIADDAVDAKTKKYIAEKINPKLNRLRGLIIDYCQLTVKGGSPSPDAITALIGDVSALFAGGKK